MEAHGEWVRTWVVDGMLIPPLQMKSRFRSRRAGSSAAATMKVMCSIRSGCKCSATKDINTELQLDVYAARQVSFGGWVGEGEHRRVLIPEKK